MRATPAWRMPSRLSNQTAEMVVNGVSTREVAKVTEKLCRTEFSKSTVSELCKRLEPLVREHMLYRSIGMSFTYTTRKCGAEQDRLFPGCVYGFAAVLREDKKVSLSYKADRKHQTLLAGIDNGCPFGKMCTPLYWGKEWESGSRAYGHLTAIEEQLPLPSWAGLYGPERTNDTLR